MKKNIHPDQVMCTFKCACGAEFKAMSNKPEQMVEVCNECHPLYTGKQGKAKKTGAIEKFNRKYGYEQEAK